MKEKCPICGSQLEYMSEDIGMKTCLCKICGSYNLCDYVLSTLIGTYNIGKYNLIKLRSALFYYLRVIKSNHLNTSSTVISISTNEHIEDYYIDLDTAYKLYPDTFSKRLDMVIASLATQIDDIGKWFDVPDQYVSNEINLMQYDIFFLPSNAQIKTSYQRVEFSRLLEELKYITTIGEYRFSFTPKGWEKVDSLQRKQNKKTAFIAMSFNFTNSIIAEAEQCIKEAIKKSGYIPQIISEKEHNNFIMDEIIYEIENSAFVVADLTEQKTGVYYEAGYARALGKEVIFTCHESDFGNRHFDIAQVNTLKWNNKENFVNDLIRRIEITVGLNKIK